VTSRRKFLGRIAVVVLGWPLASLAQQATKVWRIGYLRRTSPQPADIAALREGLQELGYVEGRSLVIEERYANGDAASLPRLARELQQLKVEVFVVDGNVTVEAIRGVVGTIPIVFTLVGDPVEAGLVAGLDRPMGSITGLATFSLGPKRLQLLREVVPMGRVGVLDNPDNPTSASRNGRRRMNEAAKSLGVELVRASARNASELASAFAELSRANVSALFVATDAIFFIHRNRIAELAMQLRKPAIYPEREYCEAGGLMSYGTSLPGNFRHAASYVDKILKGAKPADLPIEQPTKFELVINLKTAKALGLTIPHSVLLRADEVIQ
jgi:putative ABC transport system substrate-binding protein